MSRIRTTSFRMISEFTRGVLAILVIPALACIWMIVTYGTFILASMVITDVILLGIFCLSFFILYGIIAIIIGVAAMSELL